MPNNFNPLKAHATAQKSASKSEHKDHFHEEKSVPLYIADAIGWKKHLDGLGITITGAKLRGEIWDLYIHRPKKRARSVAALAVFTSYKNRDKCVDSRGFRE